MAATVSSVSAIAVEADGTLGVTITAPSGITTGDLLIAVVGQNTADGASWACSGWTEHDSAAYSTVVCGAVFYKIAVSADESATDYTFTRGTSASNKKTGRIFRVTGHHATWSDYTPTAATSAASTTAVAPSETTTEANVLLIRAVFVDRNRMSGATPVPSISDESHADADETATASGHGSGWELQASAGSTGTQSWTLESATSDEYVGYTVGIRSAAASSSQTRALINTIQNGVVAIEGAGMGGRLIE